MSWMSDGMGIITGHIDGSLVYNSIQKAFNMKSIISTNNFDISPFNDFVFPIIEMADVNKNIK